MTQFATLVYGLGIVVLFALDHDRKSRTSKALWLPVVWLFLNASRPVSVWLQLNTGQAQSAVRDLEGSPLDRSIYLGLLAAGIVVLVGRRTIVIRFLRANLPILLFIVYAALSTVWSDYPDVAFKRWIKYLSDVVMVLIVLTDPMPSCAIKRLVTRVGFVLVPLSVLVIKYYPDISRYYSPWEGIMFVSGVAEDKNMLGLACLVFGLGVWWRLLGTWIDGKSRNRTRRMIAHSSILAMVAWLFWMANSVTSLSCFVMAGGLMAMTMLLRAARKPAVMHLLAASVVCVSFSTLFLNAGGGALQAMGRNPTLTGRTEIWKGLLTFAGNPLFGTGFESFWLGERLRRIWATGGLLYGINESHNGYLEIYLNLGWIGIALLAAIIVHGYRNIVRAVRLDRQTHCLHLAYFIAALVYNFTEAAFRVMSPMSFVFLYAVLAIPRALAVKEAPVPASAATEKYFGTNESQVSAQLA